MPKSKAKASGSIRCSMLRPLLAQIYITYGVNTVLTTLIHLSITQSLSNIHFSVGSRGRPTFLVVDSYSSSLKAFYTRSSWFPPRILTSSCGSGSSRRSTGSPAPPPPVWCSCRFGSGRRQARWTEHRLPGLWNFHTGFEKRSHCRSSPAPWGWWWQCWIRHTSAAWLGECWRHRTGYPKTDSWFFLGKTVIMERHFFF